MAEFWHDTPPEKQMYKVLHGGKIDFFYAMLFPRLPYRVPSAASAGGGAAGVSDASPVASAGDGSCLVAGGSGAHVRLSSGNLQIQCVVVGLTDETAYRGSAVRLKHRSSVTC